MFEVGECVIFMPDGSRGTVVEVERHRCHVVWEDHFVSWEKVELLVKANAAIAKFSLVMERNQVQ